jgi:flavodoxin
MKTLIVYISYHHGNTEKIAKAMGEVLESELRDPESTKPESVSEYDLIGFASGNYFGKFDKRLVAFIDSLPRGICKPAFIFSTHGGESYKQAHEELKKRLGEKGLNVVGEWHCKAFDTFGPLKLMGGINKGRPNEADVQDAKRFAEGLRSK